ncbi:MAG: hypothetical protein NC394_06905 [Bacteroides sp.]|nr:hypothetical protein [Bacteroides sp.]
MKIDILSKTTLKLTLTPEDMNENQLCYEFFSRQGSRCRQTLGKLLKSSDKPEGAAMAARLLNNERRLFVEAFRRTDGGCMLYVSALENRGKRLLDSSCTVSPIIFKPYSEKDLGFACRCLKQTERQGARFHSRLFSDSADYRLALIPMNVCTDRIVRLLKEFGEVCCDELTSALTEEHYRVIAEERGAEMAARIF